jgi:transposase
MAPKKMSTEVKRKRKAYTPEYRSEVVARCKQPGNSASSVAKELGIPASSVYLWLAQANPGEAGRSSFGFDEQRELEELRRDNKRLSKDCEILRCAVAHFAKRSMS